MSCERCSWWRRRSVGAPTVLILPPLQVPSSARSTTGMPRTLASHRGKGQTSQALALGLEQLGHGLVGDLV